MEQVTQSPLSSPKKSYTFWIFAAIIIIFIGPIIASWSFFHTNSVYGTVNHGQLIEPPVPITQFNLQNTDNTPFVTNVLKGSWSLLYVTTSSCSTMCKENLYNMRQVRLALGKDSDRVQRLLITNEHTSDLSVDTLIDQSYIGTLHAEIDPAVYTQFLLSSSIKGTNGQGEALYVVDPLGNIMMSYRPDTSAEDILNDLNRLLRVSQIG
jgi:cytochrome oxidase Cu insertion factor (SCO1/SenC/PrrC family)